MKRFTILLAALLALAASTRPSTRTRTQTFEVSAFCHCRKCTSRGDGITASGARARQGVTIAAPRSIPFGSRIYIPGAGWRTVQDRLSRRFDHRIDLYFNSHQDALKWGVKTLNCTINQ